MNTPEQNRQNAERRVRRKSDPPALYNYRVRYQLGKKRHFREVAAGNIREVMKTLPPSATHLKVRRGEKIEGTNHG